MSELFNGFGESMTHWENRECSLTVPNDVMSFDFKEVDCPECLKAMEYIALKRQHALLDKPFRTQG